MNYDSDDALDRALFALPLEEPPTDLRAAILTATVYRPEPAFAPWEIGALAAILAVVISLVSAVVMGGGSLFVHSAETIGTTLVRSLSDYATLAWLAAGGATAIWLSLFTGFQSFAPLFNKVGRTPTR
jgi:hypothetical protein